MHDNPRPVVCNPPILLTRPAAQADRFAALLRARLGNPQIVIAPILSIEPRPVQVDGARFDAVVLTSENGARMAANLPGMHGKLAYCVGDRTAQIALDLGFRPRSAQGNADDLVALIQSEAPQGRLLLARGAETRGAVAERLQANGIAVDSHILYDQVPCPLSPAARALLEAPGPVLAPLFSPCSAVLVGKAWKGAAASPILVCLSKAVSAAWAGPDTIARSVANRPDANEVLSRIAAFYTDPLP